MNKLFLFLLVLFFSAEIFSQPQPPTNLTAEQNNWGTMVRVKLTWDAPNATPVHYNIYRRHGSLNDTTAFIKKYTHVFGTVFYDRNVQNGNTYCYYVTAYNLQGQSEPSNIVEITLGNTQSHGIIAGTILNETTNLPIPGARATIIPVLGGFNTTVMTDSNGNFSKNVIAGNYFVRSTAMGYIPEFFDNAPTIETAQQITVAGNDSFYLPVTLSAIIPPVTFHVSGTVTDSAGNPLRAMMHAYKVFSNTDHGFGCRVPTDSLGNYTLTVRENDTIVVHAMPLNIAYLPEFYNNKSTFEDADRIVVTGNITGIDFVLEPKPVYANGITGTVKNAAGDPVISFVNAFRKTAISSFERRKYFTQTDSLGIYGLSNMIPGEYILLACPRQGYMRTYFRYDGTPTLNWFEADSVVVTDNGIVEGINFTVVPFTTDGFAVVNGFATDNQGNPVNGAHIYALDVNNQIYTYTLTDKNGFYVLNGLQPGEYKLYSDKFDFNSTSGKSLNINSLIQTSQVDFILTPDAVTNVDNNPSMIGSYELYQNYPNPFNPSTTIKFAVPEQGLVKLTVYDMLGREIKTLFNEVVNEGLHSVQFDASDLSSGVYLYKIQANNYSSTKKLMLLK